MEFIAFLSQNMLLRHGNVQLEVTGGLLTFSFY